jgi:two-component system response regulator FixJ
MPDMDGLEIQRHLAGRDVALPIIVMTGHGDLAVAGSALQGGAVAFLEKPFAKAALTQALDAAFLKIEEPEAYDRQLAASNAAVQALGEDDKALLAGVAAGQSNEKIAADLGVGAAVVEVRRARLFSELGVESLNEALRMACAAGLRDFT